MPYPTDPIEIIGIAISVILIWGIYSFPLYKENDTDTIIFKDKKRKQRINP